MHQRQTRGSRAFRFSGHGGNGNGNGNANGNVNGNTRWTATGTASAGPGGEPARRQALRTTPSRRQAPPLTSAS